MKSLYEIKRAVIALQKEVEELKALIKEPKPEMKEKPNGEKRTYRRRDTGAN